VLSQEATNTNLIGFGLTRLRLVPTIYHTQGEHDNHYTTNAVDYKMMNMKFSLNVKKNYR